MKKKNRFVFGAAILVVALLFWACPSSNDPGTGQYTVKVSTTGEGTLQVEPAGGPAGTPVKVRAYPAAGHRLTGLVVDGTSILQGSEPWEFTLNGNVTVTATFEAVQAGNYTVSIDPELENGTITAEPKDGPEGTEITLSVAPEAGYGLQEGSLKYSFDNTDVVLTVYKFALPAANVTVTAKFESKTAGQFLDAGIDALAAGDFDVAIDAFESAWQQDKTNTEAIVYSSLGRLASIAKDQNVRNLMLSRLGFTSYPGTIDKLITTDWMATYTGENLVGGYYENGKWLYWYDQEDAWVAKYLQQYELPLKAGYYYSEQLPQTRYTLVKASAEKITGPLDRYYDDDRGAWVYWYDWDLGNGYQGPGYYYWTYTSDTAIFVSGTKKTGPLDNYYDDDFGSTIYWHASEPGGGSQGSGYYWSTDHTYILNSETPRYDRWTEKMPGLSLPSWFENSGAYKDNLTSAGALQASQWPLLFFANLVEKNQNGLNSLLDDILSSVFGSAFDDAAGRSKDLSYDQVIELDAELVEAFGLTELFEGDDIYVGKAELDLLFSSLRIFKATLEWVAAYNWDTDVSFLRTDWTTIEDISTLSPKNLPLGNNFMKDRNNGMMAKSREDFVKALATAVVVYEHLSSADSELPEAYVDELKNYGWLKDGLSKLGAAIENGGTFYVPEQEPSGSSYDNSAANALIGINMGKLFTPGQFAIDQLIETESGGKAPQFYAFHGSDPVAITSKEQFDALDEYVGFRLKLGRIKEVIVKGLDDVIPADETAMDMPLFPAQFAKELYGLYHK
jgi:hypothetical protein